MSVLSKRYAEALLEAAAAQNKLNDYTKQLKEVAGIVLASSELKAFLEDPKIIRKEKKRVLGESLENRLERNIIDFLLLLIDKNRIMLLQEITDEFEYLADKLANTLRMTVVSAKPIDSSQLETLKEKYRVKYGASSVKAEVRIDESLIGGIKTIIGDTVVDGSIKGRLEGLRELINKIPSERGGGK